MAVSARARPASRGRRSMSRPTIGDSAFPRCAPVATGTGRGIQVGLGGGEESRWATVDARVADVDQPVSRAGKLGGAPISDPGVPALKAAARAALYGSAGTMA